ncbi:helix-turn-helix domain-containing protein [Lentzea sp. NPDC006480]|uniref:helix-turn-helix domain-containing protein n=1 Tax=Lentzea sp. NPDC006480 TaxID=3157176 RepID=UPI0033A60664
MEGEGTKLEGVYARLGQELLRLRLQRGLSLRKLARQLGMTAHSGIVDYERGVRIPPADLMTTYVQVLKPDGNRLAQLYEAAVAARAQQRVLDSIQTEIPLGPADVEWVARQYVEQIMALNNVVRALEELTSKLSAAIA